MKVWIVIRRQHAQYEGERDDVSVSGAYKEEKDARLLAKAIDSDWGTSSEVEEIEVE